MITKISQEKGVAVIITFLTLGVLLLLGFYFLNFTLTESKISKSQVTGTQTYYLAEAGIAEAIWKLKNDPEWKTNFETEPGCRTWSASFSKNGVLFTNGSYQVQIKNSDCARGQIISTAKLNLPGGKTSQRIIKTKVLKTIGSLTWDSAVFSGGTSENIEIMFSKLNIYNGNLLSNHNLDIKYDSEVRVYDNPDTSSILEGQVLVNGNITVKDSTLDNCEVKCAKNVCEQCLNQTHNEICEVCPSDIISMPMVDFDSKDPNSYQNQTQTAQNTGQCSVLCNEVLCSTKCVFTTSEFEDLLWQVGKEGTLTLNNKITYVTGPIELRGGRNLRINGTLVADDSLDIGERSCWTRGGRKDCGFSQITITDPGIGIPSGLLTKSKINFGPYSSFQDIEIVGLVYANDEIRLVSLPLSFNLTGGMLARKIALTSIWSPLNIYLDNLIISEGIWAGPLPPEGEKPPYSPVVTVEHWEESY